MTNDIEKKQADDKTESATTAVVAAPGVFAKLKSSLAETALAVVAGGAVAWFFIDSVEQQPPQIGAALSAPGVMAQHSAVDDYSCSDSMGGGGNKLSCLMKKEKNTLSTNGIY